MTKWLELSLPAAAANLALDEALLVAAEADELPPVLRLWQFPATTVVLGRGSRAAEEVDLAFCQANQIPVLRRCSGGATVVGGEGCLMYSLVIDLRIAQELRSVDRAHVFVMEAMVAAVRSLMSRQDHQRVAYQGICDLTFDNQKFSGNSLRIARNHLLYHGTILLHSDLDLIAACLGQPPRQPDYRGKRSHREFITNVSLDRKRLIDAIRVAFKAEQPLVDWPRDRTQALTKERYSTADWNFRH